MTKDALQNSREKTLFSVKGAGTIVYLYEKRKGGFLKLLYMD